MSTQPAQHKTTVQVNVIFPISVEGPFHAEESRASAVGTILRAAMTHFKVSADTQHEYYLTHDGRRISDEATVGEVAEHRDRIRFTLVKELVQGLIQGWR